MNLPSKTFGELAEHAYGTPRIAADDLAQCLARGERLVVLDGRPVSEFRKMNIPTALCCPNGELPYRVKSIVPDDTTPIVVNCAGRTRSIIGAQTLIDLGVRNPVYALENGTQGWYLRDHKLEHGGTRAYAPDSGSPALRENAQQLAARFGAELSMRRRSVSGLRKTTGRCTCATSGPRRNSRKAAWRLRSTHPADSCCSPSTST